MNGWVEVSVILFLEAVVVLKFGIFLKVFNAVFHVFGAVSGIRTEFVSKSQEGENVWRWFDRGSEIMICPVKRSFKVVPAWLVPYLNASVVGCGFVGICTEPIVPLYFLFDEPDDFFLLFLEEVGFLVVLFLFELFFFFELSFPEPFPFPAALFLFLAAGFLGDLFCLLEELSLLLCVWFFALLVIWCFSFLSSAVRAAVRLAVSSATSFKTDDLSMLGSSCMASSVSAVAFSVKTSVLNLDSLRWTWLVKNWRRYCFQLV